MEILPLLSGKIYKNFTAGSMIRRSKIYSNGKETRNRIF